MKNLKKKALATIIAAISIANMPVTWADEIGIYTINKDINVKDAYKSVKKEESTYIKNYVSESKNANTVVNIPDANLKKGIYKTLGKEYNETITKGELESIRYLRLPNSEITNLEGIQNCINLECLYLGRNNISDIKPLSNLFNLTSLDLSSNNITDIKPISKLIDLIDLDLEYNNISDISALSELVKLDYLYLSNNQISDISPLSELINLDYLYLSNNQISDISALSELVKLDYLYLSNNQISDISPLSRLIKLIDLLLNNNQISDISPLSELDSLYGLYLENNQISDISPLSELTVYELYLKNNQISDISPLEGKIILTSLDLRNNQISNIKPLSGLQNLEYLFLGNNKISDITPLLNLNITCSYIDLRANFLDLNDLETKKVIQYLRENDNILYYEGQLSQIPQVELNDIKGHWAQSQIINFVSNGYVGGYPDSTFRPNNSITRAEFVKIFNKYFGLTKTSGKVFNDTTTHWAKSEIDIAVTNGVANGVSATEFKPDEPITREQAAVMICNYKKLSDKNHDKINKYSDKGNVSSWAKDSVEGVIEKGYMNGYSDNTFRPKNNITRAEAVVTLSRIIK